MAIAVISFKLGYCCVDSVSLVRKSIVNTWELSLCLLTTRINVSVQ